MFQVPVVCKVSRTATFRNISFVTSVTVNLIPIFIARLGPVWRPIIARHYREYRFCVVDVREAFYSRPDLNLCFLNHLNHLQNKYACTQFITPVKIPLTRPLTS